MPAYRAMRARDSKFALTEDVVNIWGLGLLHDGRKREAIAVLTFNVQQYPNSANAHDSLAEAYEKAGKKAAAITSYRQALALDPKVQSAIERLKVLAPKPGR
jgi:Tfp pilus assembly protein PilF